MYVQQQHAVVVIAALTTHTTPLYDSVAGMTNKLSGRMGDTPIIGAGTYANNCTCAVSCTGTDDDCDVMMYAAFLTIYLYVLTCSGWMDG